MRTDIYRTWYGIVPFRLVKRIPTYIRDTSGVNGKVKCIKSWLFRFDHDDIRVLII